MSIKHRKWWYFGKNDENVWWITGSAIVTYFMGCINTGVYPVHKKGDKQIVIIFSIVVLSMQD